MGAELLCRTITDIGSGTAPRVKQDDSLATYVKPLTKDMSPINWSRSPREIVKHICGLDPWPVATGVIGGVSLRIWRAEYTQAETTLPPGSVVAAGERGIEMAVGGGTLLITEVQAANSKRMSAAEYLRGHKL